MTDDSIARRDAWRAERARTVNADPTAEQVIDAVAALTDEQAAAVDTTLSDDEVIAQVIAATTDGPTEGDPVPTEEAA
jgi:hypothetical protein